jgi:hypothetical protein
MVANSLTGVVRPVEVAVVLASVLLELPSSTSLETGMGSDVTLATLLEVRLMGGGLTGVEVEFSRLAKKPNSVFWDGSGAAAFCGLTICQETRSTREVAVAERPSKQFIYGPASFPLLTSNSDGRTQQTRIRAPYRSESLASNSDLAGLT